MSYRCFNQERKKKKKEKRKKNSSLVQIGSGVSKGNLDERLAKSKIKKSSVFKVI